MFLGWTSVAVWDGSQRDAFNRPLSRALRRENLLEGLNEKKKKEMRSARVDSAEA